MSKLGVLQEMADLIEQARKLGPMTDAQRREQAASFAFGNLALTGEWRDKSGPELEELRVLCRKMAGIVEAEPPRSRPWTPRERARAFATRLADKGYWISDRLESALVSEFETVRIDAHIDAVEQCAQRIEREFRNGFIADGVREEKGRYGQVQDRSRQRGRDRGVPGVPDEARERAGGTRCGGAEAPHRQDDADDDGGVEGAGGIEQEPEGRTGEASDRGRRVSTRIEDREPLARLLGGLNVRKGDVEAALEKMGTSGELEEGKS